MTYTEVYPRTVQELEPYLQFMYDSLIQIADERRANTKITRSAFFRVCLFCLQTSTQESPKIIVLLDGINPIGYGMYFENTPWWETKKVGLIYAVYVPGDNPRACALMLDRCMQSACNGGMRIVETYARRFNAAAFRYYEKRHGFKMNAYVFRKELE